MEFYLHFLILLDGLVLKHKENFTFTFPVIVFLMRSSNLIQINFA